ncbi:hypothetical protein B0H16DRAFT_1456927 [Mycena metata]|uniref:Uncharacterized protein n=1 Tax=Mycena metata TaxID=1033252 RepID=A0AAD7JBK1_9AGAR|nr:hypothetical protein B0H16DRAFT_1456927 [Mycena metata]
MAPKNWFKLLLRMVKRRSSGSYSTPWASQRPNVLRWPVGNRTVDGTNHSRVNTAPLILVQLAEIRLDTEPYHVYVRLARQPPTRLTVRTPYWPGNRSLIVYSVFPAPGEALSKFACIDNTNTGVNPGKFRGKRMKNPEPKRRFLAIWSVVGAYSDYRDSVVLGSTGHIMRAKEVRLVRVQSEKYWRTASASVEKFTAITVYGTATGRLAALGSPAIVLTGCKVLGGVSSFSLTELR